MNRLFLLAFSALVACTPELTGIAYIPSRDHPTCAVVKVTDGDTIRVNCGEGEIPARLMGYDTPETYKPGCDAEYKLGKQASRYLEKRLAQADFIEPHLNGAAKYNRALLRLKLDGVELSRIMIDAGLAVPYSGGKRIDWCARLKS
jgi:endonuclease YncB( thermonuclease family)